MCNENLEEKGSFIKNIVESQSHTSLYTNSFTLKEKIILSINIPLIKCISENRWEMNLLLPQMALVLFTPLNMALGVIVEFKYSVFHPHIQQRPLNSSHLTHGVLMNKHRFNN